VVFTKEEHASEKCNLKQCDKGFRMGGLAWYGVLEELNISQLTNIAGLSGYDHVSRKILDLYLTFKSRIFQI
jgi:hypothetical protein